ncbi:MAG: hypothetical protein N3G21_13465 [Candidatus Hydrogenedentes bacterium]|nr:hypothetical protein [Candidatus Hydrogenedentota bacterium]
MEIKFDKWNPENKFNEEAIGLWIFSIDDKDICFWGHYQEVIKNLENYVNIKNLTDRIIYVIDCIEYNRFFKEETLIK